MKYRLRKEFTQNPEQALLEILSDRGVKDLNNFINPSFACELNPYDLENIEVAAELLLKHLHNKDAKILEIVDADADGYTSASILWLYIKHSFPDANLNFVVHEHKQHGLNDLIGWLEDEDYRYDLIIVPDAGSYDAEEHNRLGALGIDVLCLDHHPQLYDDDGNAIVSNNPHTVIVNNQLSPKYANKSLCGAGVVYKFCEVLDDILELQMAPEFLDLAALGEIADVMERQNTETNYIMMTGLANIRNKGFATLIESQAFSLKDKAVAPYIGLTPIDIAFYIAPLINAIVRVGTMEEKETLFYCFIDPDRQVQSTKRGALVGDMETAAGQTARVGKNAKAKQDRIKEKALAIIDDRILKGGLDENNIIIIELTDDDNIPQEMTGLIAMAVVSKYHKPCMIGRFNSRNELQGSVRSDSNFNGLPSFKKFLEDSNLIMYAAGHDAACGFGINGNKIDQLIQYSNTVLDSKDLENCYVVDYILDGRESNASLLTVLGAYPQFFGNHIDEIKVVIKNISTTSLVTMGTNKDSAKISYNGIDYVRFKDTNFIDAIHFQPTALLTVYGRINLNHFMGRTTVQLFVDDYELVDDENKYEF